MLGLSAQRLLPVLSLILSFGFGILAAYSYSSGNLFGVSSSTVVYAASPEPMATAEASPLPSPPEDNVRIWLKQQLFTGRGDGVETLPISNCFATLARMTSPDFLAYQPHLYQRLSDDNGLVSWDLPIGRYRLFVACDDASNYRQMRLEIILQVRPDGQIAMTGCQRDEPLTVLVKIHLFQNPGISDQVITYSPCA